MQIQSLAQWPDAAGIFREAVREVRPHLEIEEVKVLYRRYVSATARVRWTGGVLEVRLADLFETAPRTALESLAHILAHKMFGRRPADLHAQRYSRFLSAPEMRQRLETVRRQRGRKYVSGGKGNYFNLDEMFEDLNFRFFHGLMARPELGWSRRESKWILGHYDPAHNAIIMSRSLDAADIPRIAVEYVLFHEMLHLRHPAEHHGPRRRVHTRPFREEEKRFPELKEAKAALKRITTGPDRWW
jgi:hypothetical protein